MLIQALLTLALAVPPQAQPPKTVSFPSMVTTTKLKAPAPVQVAELNTIWQQALSQNNSNKPGLSVMSNGQQSYLARFGTQKSKSKPQILIPENGDFQLVLQAGTEFKILDANATDGQAQIQFPAGTLETLLHLPDSLTGNRSLRLKDDLYYVEDTLNRDTTGQWYALGNRPLPVPSDWYSPDGQQFILRFAANQISDFQMFWLQQDQPAPFPPGINEIGAEGGIVELPGVAKLEIPAGAIPTKQTVALKQVFEAASMQEYCPFPDHPENCYPGWVFAAPIIKILPLGLELQQAASLELPTYKQYLDLVPSSIKRVANLSVLDTQNWSYYPNLAPTEYDNLDYFNQHEIVIPIKILSYVTRRTRYNAKF